MKLKGKLWLAAPVLALGVAALSATAAEVAVVVKTPMEPPSWATRW